MRWNIRTKINLMVAIGCLAIAINIASGWWADFHHTRLIEDMERFTSALRRHQVVDMMHDAVRGDMMSLQLAHDDQQIAMIRNDLGDHAKAMRDNLAVLGSETKLSPAAKTALIEVTPVIKRYLIAAEEIMARGVKDPAGLQALLPGFNTLFKDLEDRLETISGLIEGQIKQVHDDSEQFQRTSDHVLLASSLFSVLMLVFSAHFITGRLLRPIRACMVAVDHLARGDLTFHPEVTSRDEGGTMAGALGQATATLSSSLVTIRDNAKAVAAFAVEMGGASAKLSVNSQETASQAQHLSNAAEQVNRNTSAIAAGLEEMSASVREIAGNTSQAAAVAGQAAQMTKANSEAMARLNTASNEIGQVVKLVAAIAQQTNLLALNATIEAARAGESGKGFAVVASEVKELARQTAGATDDIAQKINAIRTETEQAVRNNANIAETIQQVSELQGSVAAMVQEQSATASEMSRGTSESAQATRKIADNIAAVARAVTENHAIASSTSATAQKLGELSTALEQLLARFKCRTP